MEVQVANFDVVKEKFGGSAALLGLHDRIADVLLTATALSAEEPRYLRITTHISLRMCICGSKHPALLTLLCEGQGHL